MESLTQNMLMLTQMPETEGFTPDHREEQEKPTQYAFSGNPFEEPITWDAAESSEPVKGFIIADPDAHGEELMAAIRRSAGGNEAPLEAAADREQRYVPIDEHGIAYVDMNKSGYTSLGPNEYGFTATDGLMGCVGAAGFVTHADGSTGQFVSHYGQYAQSAEVTGLDSPINEQMSEFDAREASKALGVGHDGPAQYVVAYYVGSLDDPDYGLRQGEFKDWHYLDQIQETASKLGPQASTLFLPYGGERLHSLAAGRDASGEGIYVDGMPIDFDDVENIAAIPGAMVVHGGSTQHQPR